MFDRETIEGKKNTIPNAPNRVRYTMNGFIIALGSYVPDLLKKAIETGGHRQKEENRPVLKRYHGIFRFLSFECIIVLVLVNYPLWFTDPLAWYQVISWSLLFGSLLIAIVGFYSIYPVITAAGHYSPGLLQKG